MVCTNCGAQVNEGDILCVKCGSKLQPASVSSQAAGAVPNIPGNVNPGYSNPQGLNVSNLKEYYQQEFQKIYESNEEYKGKFNLCAFLFGMIWAFTKGCWLAAVMSLIAALVTAPLFGIGGVVYWFIFGFRGTYIYYRRYVKGKQCIF